MCAGSWWAYWPISRFQHDIPGDIDTTNPRQQLDQVSDAGGSWAKQTEILRKTSLPKRHWVHRSTENIGSQRKKPWRIYSWVRQTDWHYAIIFVLKKHCVGCSSGQYINLRRYKFHGRSGFIEDCVSTRNGASGKADAVWEDIYFGDVLWECDRAILSVHDSVPGKAHVHRVDNWWPRFINSVQHGFQNRLSLMFKELL